MQPHKSGKISTKSRHIYGVFVDRVSVLKEKLPKAFEEHVSINVGIAPPLPFNSLGAILVIPDTGLFRIVFPLI